MYAKTWYYCSLHNIIHVAGIPFTQGVFTLLSWMDGWMDGWMD